MATSDHFRHGQGTQASCGHDPLAHRYPRNAADLLKMLSHNGPEGDGLGGDWENHWIDLGGEG